MTATTNAWYVLCKRYNPDDEFPVRDIYYGPFTQLEAIEYKAFVQRRPGGCDHIHMLTMRIPLTFHPVGVRWPPR